jgi:hypothetical protein
MVQWWYSSTFLNSALDGGESLASRLDSFTLGKSPPSPQGIHWIRVWMDLRAYMDFLEEGKNSVCIVIKFGTVSASGYSTRVQAGRSRVRDLMR